MDRLIELVSTCRVYYPPTAEEVDLLVPGTMPEAAGAPDAPDAMELLAQRFVIQNAAVVNVYITRDGD